LSVLNKKEITFEVAGIFLMINRLLDNRYRIKKLIGEGGMASVYLAFDEKLHRNVAVKILHSHLSQDQEIRQRFNLEARALSGTEHPNIINIYDFSGLESKQLWIVTEVLHGMNLAQYLSRFHNNKLQYLIGSLLILEVLKALKHAHDKGIVHRDIKPENIMVLNSGQIKLMDFGISKNIHINEMTKPGAFMGSPSYMSPEQIRGKDVDHRSDIYSVCVLFYEIITGTLPFTGETTPEVINKILVGKYAAPKQLVPELNDEINAIIVKGISATPDERFINVKELMSVLNHAILSQGFDESHIELERFIKNPKKFLSRVQSGSRYSQRAVTKTGNYGSHALHNSSLGGSGNIYASKNNLPAMDPRMMTPPSRPTKTKNIAPQIPPPPLSPPANNQAAAPGPRVSLPHSPTNVAVAGDYQTKIVSPVKRPRNAPNVRGGGAQQAISSIQSKSPFIVWFFGVTFIGAIAFALIWITTAVLLSLQNDMTVQQAAPAESRPVIKSTTKPSMRKESRTSSSTGKPLSKAKDKTAVGTPASKALPVEETLQTPVITAITVKKTRLTPTPAAASKPSVKTKSSVASATANEPKASPTPLGAMRSAFLNLDCTASALIFIDGKVAGTCEQLMRGIALSAGKHTIKSTKAGYQPLETTISLEEKETRSLTLHLTKALSSVPFTVKSNRVPFNITIRSLSRGNDKNMVKTFGTKTAELALPEGKYSITVEYHGQSIQRTVILAPDNPQTFNAMFKE
jgi:serine/threonine protein kinase